MRGDREQSDAPWKTWGEEAPSRKSHELPTVYELLHAPLATSDRRERLPLRAFLNVDDVRFERHVLLANGPGDL